MTGRHTLSFLVVGHTKFVDFLRECLQDMVNKSASPNRSVFSSSSYIHLSTQYILHNWHKLTWFQMQHSPASSRSGRGDRCTNLQLDWLLDSSLQETDRDKEGVHPGVVFMKQRGGFDPGEFPDTIEPSAQRQWYLHDKIREILLCQYCQLPVNDRVQLMIELVSCSITRQLCHRPSWG